MALHAQRLRAACWGRSGSAPELFRHAVALHELAHDLMLALWVRIHARQADDTQAARAARRLVVELKVQRRAQRQALAPRPSAGRQAGGPRASSTSAMRWHSGYSCSLRLRCAAPCRAPGPAGAPTSTAGAAGRQCRSHVHCLQRQARPLPAMGEGAGQHRLDDCLVVLRARHQVQALQRRGRDVINPPTLRAGKR